MNVCSLSGRVFKNATSKGTEPKTLSFMLETRYGNGEKGKERSAFVPCVMFNPDPEIESILTAKGEGLHVEFEGRISGQNPDANGGRKYGSEVIVRNRTLTVFSPTGEA
jgi:hypothetical protein